MTCFLVSIRPFRSDLSFEAILPEVCKAVDLDTTLPRFLLRVTVLMVAIYTALPLMIERNSAQYQPLVGSGSLVVRNIVIMSSVWHLLHKEDVFSYRQLRWPVLRGVRISERRQVSHLHDAELRSFT
jgi:hypothetical protein